MSAIAETYLLLTISHTEQSCQIFTYVSNIVLHNLSLEDDEIVYTVGPKLGGVIENSTALGELI